MAEFVDPTLLPPPLARDLNARALEAVAARISAIDLTPLVVYDFDTVPKSALPSLAEQFRVLGDAGWNLATTEDQQRALLKEAISLHRVRGTTYSVERVLEILGVNAMVIEWFQSNPQSAPYTFTLVADTLSQPLGFEFDTATLAKIVACVNYWKAARSAFSFQLGSLGLPLTVSFAAVAIGSLTEEIDASFYPDAIGVSIGDAAILKGYITQSLSAAFATDVVSLPLSSAAVLGGTLQSTFLGEFQ